MNENINRLLQNNKVGGAKMITKKALNDFNQLLTELEVVIEANRLASKNLSHKEIEHWISVMLSMCEKMKGELEV